MPSRIPKFATDFDFFTLPRLLFLLIITIFFFRKKRGKKNQTPQTRANPPDRYESGGKNPRTEGHPRTRIKENWFYLKSQDRTSPPGFEEMPFTLRWDPSSSERSVQDFNLLFNEARGPSLCDKSVGFYRAFRLSGIDFGYLRTFFQQSSNGH